MKFGHVKLNERTVFNLNTRMNFFKKPYGQVDKIIVQLHLSKNFANVSTSFHLRTFVNSAQYLVITI